MKHTSLSCRRSNPTSTSRIPGRTGARRGLRVLRVAAWAIGLAGLAAARPAAGAAPQQPPVKATAVGLPHPDISEEVFANVMRALGGQLKENPRLEFKDLDTRLADFAQDVPGDQVEAARQALADGQKALLELDLDNAAKKFEEATKRLADVLPFIKKQELADAMVGRALALAEAGNMAEARKQFVRLLIWRSDYVYDATKLPPQHLHIFEEAQKEVGKLRAGSLRIQSKPEGAQAFVDGKYYGLTPCVAGNLTAGEHFVTFKKEGYLKAAIPAVVPARKEKRVDVSLKQNEKYLLIEQTVQVIDKSIGEPTVPAEMDTFRQVLFVDVIVFVRARPKEGDQGEIDVTGYLYDLRTKKWVSQMNKVITPADIDMQAGQLAQGLSAAINLTGELARPAEPALPEQRVRKPLYKTWWLWTAVGAVVAAGIGTGLGVGLTAPPSCPSGNYCPSIRF
ncbi:MAG TPA: PEGA domain-containing protein [Polyangia bacterium]|nr:PEGA domain-containing protein [Polyangia bacterium]